jgi:SAM-dependent methyltransferase
MTKNEFITRGEELSRKAGVMDGLHGYFRQSASRLYQSCRLFDLFSAQLGDVLEIGPFYGYTPFLLRKNSTSYSVLEGDDPAVYPLVPIYKDAAIAFSCLDLFDVFGPAQSAAHRLPSPDGSYDTILCWETMEHFNFNPVKFVRELHRALKPSGRVCITVPNRASFQCIFALLFGRGEKSLIDSYFTYENYQSNGKNAFYGFHWREYTQPELTALFTQVGFRVEICRTFTDFHDHGNLGLGRRLARLLSQVGAAIFSRYGTNVYLIAKK